MTKEKHALQQRDHLVQFNEQNRTNFCYLRLKKSFFQSNRNFQMKTKRGRKCYLPKTKANRMFSLDNRSLLPQVNLIACLSSTFSHGDLIRTSKYGK